MSWREERVTMSVGRAAAIVIGTAISLSMVVHLAVLVVRELAGEAVQWRLLAVIAGLTFVSVVFHGGLALWRLLRRRRRLQRMRSARRA